MWSSSWNIDSMAIGEHLGSSQVRTVDTYDRSRYLAIMGDPTLRLYRIPPPANVNSSTNSTTFTLTWSTSGGTTYHVFGGNALDAAFTQLTATPISTGTYTDNPRRYSYYMVKALKLITTPNSGTYTEVSQGVAKP